jgi:hypothetical protein
MPNASHQDGGGGGVGVGGAGFGCLGGTVCCLIPAGDLFPTLMSSQRLTVGFLTSCNISIQMLRASFGYN